MAKKAQQQVAAPSLPEISAAEHAPSWIDRLLYKDPKRTQVDSGSLHNVRLFLCNSDKYKGLFAYDGFCHETKMIRCPLWTHQDKFAVHRVMDEDISHLAVALELDDLRPGPDNLNRMVDITARENPVHPARDYLNTLIWDQVPRLDTWLAVYCGATRDDPEYLAAIGKTWLVGAATRILRPGAKLDGMLVLEGEPNAGKSLVLKELATFNGEAYFTDQVTLDKLNDKDSSMILMGKIICEFSELSGYNKREKEDIKRWITVEIDEFRRPYGKRVEKFPRQFVSAATHNPVGGWLTDPTGNRKFWPVLVGRRIDIDGVKRDREQLWAEAMHHARQGYDLRLSEAVFEKASAAQEERRAFHPWTDDITSLLFNHNFITVPEIMKGIGLTDARSRGGREAKDIASILMIAGWEPAREYRLGKTLRGWRRKADGNKETP